MLTKFSNVFRCFKLRKHFQVFEILIVTNPVLKIKTVVEVLSTRWTSQMIKSAKVQIWTHFFKLKLKHDIVVIGAERLAKLVVRTRNIVLLKKRYYQKKYDPIDHFFFIVWQIPTLWLEKSREFSLRKDPRPVEFSYLNSLHNYIHELEIEIDMTIRRSQKKSAVIHPSLCLLAKKITARHTEVHFLYVGIVRWAVFPRINPFLS